MSGQLSKHTISGDISSRPTPEDVQGILHDADILLELMGRETLPVVAELAETLMICAHDAGVSEIEAAANTLRRLASGHRPVALTEAMRGLTEAIARTEKRLAA